MAAEQAIPAAGHGDTDAAVCRFFLQPPEIAAFLQQGPVLHTCAGLFMAVDSCYSVASVSL
jgi:UDP-N-acetylglucosamine 2-epimerase